MARVVALVILLVTATAAAEPAETPPQVELVTMGIGALMWERHGHIAMCVTQHGLRESLASPAPGDGCYNYGIADFKHPVAMAWGFLRGTHSFWVGKLPTHKIWEIYQHADRTIWVQPLPLDPAQKAKVIAKLDDDIREEHRFYAYDHFADNCTTRIRDIIDNATDHALANMTEPAGDRTYRDYARDGFYGMKVPLVITDIVMGRSSDRIPSYWDRMFLPQYLREAVQKKWGVAPYVVYTREECRRDPDPSCVERGIRAPANRDSGRWWFALVILVLTSPAWLARITGRLERTGLAIAVVPYVLLGSLVTALAVLSPLPYFHANEIILVWFPLDLAILFLSPALQVTYARARVALLAAVALMCLVGMLHQPLWAPLLWPLVPMATVAFVKSRRAL